MKKGIYILIVFLLSAQVVLSQQELTSVKSVKVPVGYTQQLNVVYKKVNNWEGRVDIYYKSGVNVKPMPILINMHGGAWRHGNKESQTGFSTYFKLGFAVANVEYRLSAQATAPAAIEDVRCVMMYLINHADSLNIDVNRIVLSGSSAGAHLALMAGLMGNNNAQFDKDCTITNKPYRIAAVIAQSTPSTLFDPNINKVLKDGAIYEWLGSAKKDDVAFAKSLSPISYINKNNPPIFLTHGDADPRVPYQQTVELDAALTKAGVKHLFITIPGGGHGGYDEQQKQIIQAALIPFLKEHLSIQ
ncbi:alpha/beta hydrolase fold domain-containing protein [Ferruginibacter yonginensis]|uniref:Alpha/beta hydrolase fold domain-containing protein n=1 Tax=Ferruginibacter yonginensis TaxID=1310416 RepID=A0ABV8QP40_9BACT